MITRPGGSNTSLVHASLAIHHPPASARGALGGQIARVEFQFNPNELQLSRSASWNVRPTVGGERGPLPEFVGTQPASLQVEVFLDGSAKPSASQVRRQVELLLQCCEVDPQTVRSKRPSPPWVRFTWGAFSTVQFVAYVESVDATYSLFSPTGEPLRATCRLSLTEVPQPTRRQNPTSGTPDAQRVHPVVAGDSLASVAWQEYGNPALWRAIAEANGIDDPMRLRPGTELLLPSAAEAHPRDRDAADDERTVIR